MAIWPGRVNLETTVQKRPEVVEGKTHKIRTGCGSLYVIVNFLDGKPFELFIKLGKAGGCASAQCEVIARLASVALRSGMGLDIIVKQLRGVSCHVPCGLGKDRISSCADAIGKILSRYVEGGTEEADEKGSGGGLPVGSGACPDCGSAIVLAEGCARCVSDACGWSRCS